MTDDLAGLAAEMKRPAPPRPGSAEALLTRLEREFGDLDTIPLDWSPETPPPVALPAPVRAPRVRTSRPLGLPRRAVWRPAVALAAAAVIAGVLVVAGDGSRPASALSLVEEARALFGALPPFEAEVFRHQPGNDVPDLAAGADPVPDIETVRLLQYRDEAHWRTTVVSNSSDNGPAELQSLASERAGDFTVADGKRIGTYLSGPNRFLISPFADMDAASRQARATADLSPEFGGFAALDAALTGGDCRVAPDASTLGRTAKRVDCRTRPGAWDTKLWIDAVTGMVLRLTSATGDRGQVLSPPFLLEVRRLDLAPVFDPAIFAVAPPAGARAVWAGNGPAPEEYRVEPDTGVSARIPVAAGGTSAMAIGEDGAVWVLGWTRRPVPGDAEPDRTLSKIDPVTTEVVFSVPVSRHAQSVGVIGGSVWVGGAQMLAYGTSDDQGSSSPARYAAFVERYDPATGRRMGEALRIDGSTDTGNLVVEGEDLWFTGGPEHAFAERGYHASYTTLVRIDPSTGQAVEELPVDGAAFGWSDVTALGGRLWIMVSSVDTSDRNHPDRNSIVAVDPARGKEVARVPLAESPVALATDGGALWVLTFGEDPDGPGILRKLDAGSGREVGRTTVGTGPACVAWAAGSVWVTNRDDGTLLRINPATLAVQNTIVVGGTPGKIAVGRDALWISDALVGTLSRVGL